MVRSKEGADMNKSSERQARYDSKATTRFGLKLNNKTDADIIEALRRSDNKQGLIKDAIREYLKKVDR